MWTNFNVLWELPKSRDPGCFLTSCPTKGFSIWGLHVDAPPDSWKYSVPTGPNTQGFRAQASAGFT